MRQRVGTCSICGGDVMGYRGAWMSILPPPPDTCSACGATSASDLIKMFPQTPTRRKFTTTDNTVFPKDFSA